jgi:DNA-binding transcriptional LysR family regulator
MAPEGFAAFGQLHLTQSTVSQQIKRLELEAGRSLFRRSTRAVALTDEDEMLLGDARRPLQLEEAARRRLAAPRLSGVVRLGVVEEIAGDTLPPALGRFARQHPDMRLEVQVGVSADLIAQIDAGRLDVVFAKGPGALRAAGSSGASPWSGRLPTGVRAAALAGLAVTPLPASAVGRGLRILGEKDGMPPLPDLDFAIFERAQPGPTAATLALLTPARA